MAPSGDFMLIQCRIVIVAIIIINILAGTIEGCKRWLVKMLVLPQRSDFGLKPLQDWVDGLDLRQNNSLIPSGIFN